MVIARALVAIFLGCSLASPAAFAQSCEPGWESAGKGTCYQLGEPYIDPADYLHIYGVLRVARRYHAIAIDAAIYKAGKLLCTAKDTPNSEIAQDQDVPFKLMCKLPSGRRVTPDKVTLRISYYDD